MSDLHPILTRSFAEHKGERGVHFYDSGNVKFLTWQETLGHTKSNDNFPTHFSDKLLDAMSNYNPEAEFVTCKAGNGQLTIELFKAEAV